MASSKLRFRAVVRRVMYADSESPVYCWRRCDENGHWLQGPQQGSAEELKEALGGELEIVFLVPGTEVVTQRVTFNASERKHLARLLPFQLEDQLTTEIDDLHFALGKEDNGQVTVAHVDREWLTTHIQDLEATGLEVHQCLVEPLLLPRLDPGWTLRYGDQIQVHYGEGLGFAVEPSLATLAFTSLAETEALPGHILLMGASQDEIKALHELIPLTVRDQITRDQIDVQIADEWDSLALDYYDPLDLRQGDLARRLPFNKWWQDWRRVGILGAVALFVYVAVSIAQIQVLNMRETDVRQQIVAVYRQVAPQGAVANPEQQLRSQIARFETGGEGSQLMPLLGTIAPLIASAPDVSLRSLNYNNQRQEIRINLQAKTYAAIRELTQAMEQKNLKVDLRNSGAQGDLQQAIIVISGAAT